MASALVPIGLTTLSTDTTTVILSIPSGYRDIKFIVGNWNSTAENTFYARMNGDSGSNYSAIYMLGGGSGSGASGSYSSIQALLLGGLYGVSLTETISAELDIFDYGQTDKHKSTLSRYNYAGRETTAVAGRWASTSAITSISFHIFGSGNFKTGTTFEMFGVLA